MAFLAPPGKPEHAFLATDSSALNDAFGRIAAAAVSPLRLTR